MSEEIKRYTLLLPKTEWRRLTDLKTRFDVEPQEFARNAVVDAIRNQYTPTKFVPISEQIAQPPIHPIGGSDIFGPISEDERDKVTKLLRILRSGRQDASQGIIWNLEWADSWLDRQEDSHAGREHASAKPENPTAKKGRGVGKIASTG